MFIRPMIKRLHKYKLIVPMAIHCISMAIVMILVYCSVPNEATQKPTSNMNVLITPRLAGEGDSAISPSSSDAYWADFTITMTRSAISQIAVP
ncbi:hypothetical protein GCK72_013127 [Caenorhabditis remanei]|uniref:Uncharacterized protein n=1 Tax=Caenorhabditis remanei TaxID=31234 RepID=A0A6A5GQ01_CAERE|nr:hypothetical protein GCK72_013127 [Caenorhabditis remanei]KAF1756673.1 hypothetical protein GCK72_013127 [Caenorhabditis remanei]